MSELKGVGNFRREEVIGWITPPTLVIKTNTDGGVEGESRNNRGRVCVERS